MCVQYCRGAQYCRVFSTMGGYLEYHGVFTTVGDIMINVGDTLSTVGCSVPLGYLEYHRDTQYCGGHHEAHGDTMSTVGVFGTMGGKIFCYLSIPQY